MAKLHNFFFCFLILFQVTAAFCQTNWSGKEKTVDGVPTVLNPKQPIISTPTVHLEKIWSVGGEDPGFIFNNITALDVDENGRVYVADVLEANIKVFSSNGSLISTFGRNGQGPGEFKSPRCLSIIPGHKILAIDPLISYPKNRFNFFNYEGTFIHSFDIAIRETEKEVKYTNNRERLLAVNKIFVSQFLPENKLLLLTNCTEKMKYSSKSVWLFDLNKKTVKKIFNIKKSHPLMIKQVEQNDRDFLNIQWCNDANGNIFLIKDIYDYTIEKLNLNGELKQIIRRDFTFPEKTKRELKKDKESSEKYVKQMKRFGLKVVWETLKYKPIIFNLYDITRSMFCDERDRLWVLTNEPYPPKRSKGVLSWFKSGNSDQSVKPTRFTWDVFDPEGRYFMKVPFDAIQPRCFVYKDGSLYFAALKDDGFPWLFKYKIQEFKK